MFNNNFKQAMKLIVGNCNSRRTGGLEIKAPDGSNQYLMLLSSWPCGSGVTTTIIVNSNFNNAGIYIGSGTTPAAESDYTLESRITSGVSGSCYIDYNSGMDERGNPQLKTVVTLTNNGASNVTVSELGFFQSVYCAAAASGSSGSSRVIMFDRTLLNTPVTIPPGMTAAISYILKTVVNE